MKLTVKKAAPDSYFKIIGSFFNLTDREYDVFNTMAVYYLVGKNPFSLEGKRQIADELGFNDYTSMNYYMKQLRDKGVIIKQDNNHTFSPLVFKQRKLPIKMEIHFEYVSKRSSDTKSLREIEPEL